MFNHPTNPKQTPFSPPNPSKKQQRNQLPKNNLQSTPYLQGTLNGTEYRD